MGGRRANAPLCLWAFDLLQLDGVRIMPMPLVARRKMLAELVAAADTPQAAVLVAIDGEPVPLRGLAAIGLAIARRGHEAATLLEGRFPEPAL
jgi:hypothetical protein